jgi:hypothetical protein
MPNSSDLDDDNDGRPDTSDYAPLDPSIQDAPIVSGMLSVLVQNRDAGGRVVSRAKVRFGNTEVLTDAEGRATIQNLTSGTVVHVNVYYLAHLPASFDMTVTSAKVVKLSATFGSSVVDDNTSATAEILHDYVPDADEVATGQSFGSTEYKDTVGGGGWFGRIFGKVRFFFKQSWWGQMIELAMSNGYDAVIEKVKTDATSVITDSLKALWIPQSQTLDAWGQFLEDVTNWGPFGLVKQIRDIWTVPANAPVATIESSPLLISGVDMTINLDWRSEADGGSWYGSVREQMRGILGYVTYGFFIFGMVKRFWPQVAI